MEATNEEEALKLARQVIERTDKGNLDIYKVLIQKAGLIANRRTAVGPGHWEFTFARRLHDNHMYFIWDHHRTEERD